MSRINAIILFSFLSLVVGFTIAYLVWGRKKPPIIESGAAEGAAGGAAGTGVTPP